METYSQDAKLWKEVTKQTTLSNYDLGFLYQYQQISAMPGSHDGSLAWVAANEEDLNRRYAAKWILVRDGQVIGDSDNPIELERKARELKIENPFITKVAPPSKSWRTAYAAQIV